MALWQLLTNNSVGTWPDGEPWDDGHKCQPGDSGFTLSGIIAYAAGRIFNYIGTPNWERT